MRATLRVSLQGRREERARSDAAPHEAHTVDVTEPAWLMDACDDSSAPLLFSCRSGECGVCALVVESGAAALDAATPRELETIALRLPGADPRTRLGCKIRLDPASGDGTPVQLVMLRSP